MKVIFYSFLPLFFLVALNANAGVKEVGNGGGAWACQTSNNIKWVQLVDLFEAQTELGLAIPDYSGKRMTEILELAKARLQTADPETFEAIEDYFELVSSKLIIVKVELKTINDAFYRLQPSPESCPHGALTYEQLANYTSFGTILVRQDFWDLLPALDQAGLLLHEVIYAYLRETKGHTDSVQARKVVGYLLSNLEFYELKQKLKKELL